ncbi:MAG TPA: hypothetical protein VMJ34_10425 [Bryobacteraceae bacterium]|nr:hypothetical protein [Bryobacteraceae bacterium]
MPRQTIRSSTIFIAVGDETRVFRSVDEVPPALREKLQKTTNGLNSATILIADRRGREEIVRAIRGLPSGVRSRLAATLLHRGSRVRRWRFSWRTLLRHWAEILLPGVIGLSVWLLLSMK